MRETEICRGNLLVKDIEVVEVNENEVAKHLYERSGFEIEGVKRNSTLVDGTYLDEFYMAKIL